ncbi:MAG: hypothetical protein ACTHME_08635 [Candidatus Nitrosocosmicus sp.]
MNKEDCLKIAGWLNFTKALNLSTNDKEQLEELRKKLIDFANEMPPPSLQSDTVIDRLIQKKKEIYDELELKYKDLIKLNNLNVSQTVDLFNKKESQLMLQLFFIDMELENLGYKK